MLQGIKKFLFPTMLIMHGIKVENRTILFIGENPTYLIGDFGSRCVKFSNSEHTYYRSNIYRRIRSARYLKYWQNLLGNESVVVRVLPFGRHERI